MAVKYIVIPEDMYRNLIRTQPEVKIGTEQAKSELDKVKRKRDTNLSAKNVVYNQELRRYLKTRKAEEENIKVEISNGLKGILKGAASTTATPQRPFRRKLFSTNTLDAFGGPSQEENEVIEADLEDEEDYQYHTPRGETEDEYDDDDIFEPQSTKPTTPKDVRYERLVNMINSNQAKYGVVDDIILNTKGKPTGTDFKTAVKHHLQPFGYKYSPGTPSGTKILITRLKKDHQAKAILKEKHIKTTAPSTSRRRSRKTKQSGGGVRKSIAKKFKPQLWRRN